VKDMFKIL